LILVTGASGTVGTVVARRLATTGRPVRLLVRDPRRVAVSGPRVETVQARFDDRGRLETAFSGVARVFLVTNDPLRPEHEANLVDAALGAGVRHAVRLSALCVTDPESNDLITRWHRDGEERLSDSGIPWTFVRPRAFMSNTLAWADMVKNGVVRAADGTAPSACVDPRDVAEVAVRALTEPGHEGRVHAVTGPAALTALEQVDQLAEALDRPVRFEHISVAQASTALSHRFPEPIAEAMVEQLRRRLDGVKGRVERTVEEVTGRAPATYRQWALDHLAAFR
jgi:(4-alkanoyl-5-oxo-2,5-dihydrofuran-3-yl)methyl phosphate reductase